MHNIVSAQKDRQCFICMAYFEWLNEAELVHHTSKSEMPLCNDNQKRSRPSGILEMLATDGDRISEPRISENFDEFELRSASMGSLCN